MGGGDPQGLWRLGVTTMVWRGHRRWGDLHGLVGLEVEVTTTVWWGCRSWGDHYDPGGL